MNTRLNETALVELACEIQSIHDDRVMDHFLGTVYGPDAVFYSTLGRTWGGYFQLHTVRVYNQNGKEILPDFSLPFWRQPKTPDFRDVVDASDHKIALAMLYEMLCQHAVYKKFHVPCRSVHKKPRAYREFPRVSVEYPENAIISGVNAEKQGVVEAIR